LKQSKLAFLAVLLALAAGAASAQDNRAPDDFGSGASYLMIPGTAFVPSNSATGYAKPFLFLHRTGGGDSEFTHPLTLPPGSAIESVTAYVTDTNGMQDVTLRMCIVFATPDGTGQDLNCDGGIGVPAVATAGTPGPTALLMPVNRTFANVQNGNDTSHILLVHLGAADASTSLHSVKVRWHRQVSPAPATATFADVPTTHGVFRFVEALAASGITGGCGGGNYCPDAPLTRGQMSVFLAVALGLHWAP
jgi:S-layer family protein